MIDSSRLLAGLPDALRETLLTCYHELASNYLERRWEPSELNGGKFCEAVYSIINGALTGSFPLQASKPDDMLRACRALENTPSNAKRVGDRSLRVLIPRVLPVLYEIRNNRRVGHVGGDVDANHMDAEVMQAIANWVLGELVRIFHDVPINEAHKIVDALVERKIPVIWEVEGPKRVLYPGMKAKNQVLMLLYHCSGWESVQTLLSSVEYSNATQFRGTVLKVLHKDRLIEYDRQKDRAQISPLGCKEVEERLLKPSLGASPKRRLRRSKRPKR